MPKYLVCIKYMTSPVSKSADLDIKTDRRPLVVDGNRLKVSDMGTRTYYIPMSSIQWWFVEDIEI